MAGGFGFRGKRGLRSFEKVLGFGWLLDSWLRNGEEQGESGFCGDFGIRGEESNSFEFQDSCSPS